MKRSQNGSSRTILVAGGAGYIGTHMVKALLAKGHRPITVDNLSNGHRHLLPGGDFVQGDIALDHIIATAWNWAQKGASRCVR